jgi:hypothetical protein
MKPLIERKRRARINKCLDDLMIFAMQSKGESIAKLEKADVLVRSRYGKYPLLRTTQKSSKTVMITVMIITTIYISSEQRDLYELSTLHTLHSIYRFVALQALFFGSPNDLRPKLYYNLGAYDLFLTIIMYICVCVYSNTTGLRPKMTSAIRPKYKLLFLYKGNYFVAFGETVESDRR